MINGISLTTEDTNTGATTNFHHIDAFNVDYRTKNAYIQVGSYVSKETFDAGKNSITINSIILENIDFNTINLEIIYNAVVSKEDSFVYNGVLV